MKINLVKIMERIAKKRPVKILVCEGHDERMLKASAEILKKKLAKIILSGELKRAVIIRGIPVSAGARKAIEMAKGKVEA